MNELREYFENNNNETIDKWIHYFEIYENTFSKFKGKPIKILEIGVNQGGSLRMWKNYFHKDSQIFGIDINPLCKQFEKDGIKIFIGSQNDVNFLNSFIEEVGGIDIIIDDGSHIMKHQITSFQILFPNLNEGGIYLCEDTHTSYWKNWGGGYRRKNSYIEYMKFLIDSLHSNYFYYSSFPDFSNYINVISFYDSIVVIEKKRKGVPNRKKTGNPVIDPIYFNEYLPKNKISPIRKMLNFIKRKLY